MCVEATTHQTPSFKRVILFGASERGYQPSSPSSAAGTRREEYPIYLTTSAQTETQAAPRAYCQPTPPLVTFFHVHTMCPLCTTAICIFLGARENLIVRRWHAPRRAASRRDVDETRSISSVRRNIISLPKLADIIFFFPRENDERVSSISVKSSHEIIANLLLYLASCFYIQARLRLRFDTI